MYYFRASPSTYLAFLRKNPKGVKCFVNELNELYQLSNVCVCVCVEHVPLIALLTIAVY